MFTGHGCFGEYLCRIERDAVSSLPGGPGLRAAHAGRLSDVGGRA